MILQNAGKAIEVPFPWVIAQGACPCTVTLAKTPSRVVRLCTEVDFLQYVEDHHVTTKTGWLHTRKGKSLHTPEHRLECAALSQFIP